MSLRDYRLPALAVASWAQVLVAVASPLAGLLVALGLGALLGIVWITRPDLRGLRLLTAVWTLSLLALVSTLAHHLLRQPEVLTSVEAVPGQSFALVTEKTLAPGDRFVPVFLEVVNGQGMSSVPASLHLPPSDVRLPPGTRLAVEGTATAETRMSARAWRIFATDTVVVEHAHPVLAGADAMRESFLARSVALGGDGGALLPGLALGDTQGVSESLESDMRRSALAHLVAVSGANCALVVGMAVVITAVSGGGIRARLIVGVATLVGFVVLVTPEPSVIRAAVMASIALVAIALGRPHQGLGVLSLTVWLLLLLDPWRSVEFAFVLSVAATAGIVLGLDPMARLLSRVMPEWLAWITALPLVAQLAVQPVVVLLRPTLSLWGVPANMLATPFVPLVTVSGLVGSISAPVAPWLSSLAAHAGWWPSSAIAAIARATANAPLTELPWWTGAAGFAAAAVSTGLVWWAVFRPRPARALWASAALVAAVSGSVLAPQWVVRVAIPSNWQIAQCDVGQGDALIVRIPRAVIAIDTGDDEARMRRCLTMLGVSHVDYLVLTHFDRDHVGQSQVFHGMVDTVLTGPTDNDDDERRLRDLARAGAHVVEVRAGDVIDLEEYALHVIWPTIQPLGEPGNDSSVVVWVEPTSVEGLSMLALGDVGEKTQSMLRARLPDSRVDVVKVSHHGSASQSPGLYGDVRPTVALIGVGAGNDYGHPAPSLLETLNTLGAHIVRSDQHGLVTLHRGDLGAIELWTERDG